MQQEELNTRCKDAFQEGLLHAATQAKLFSIGNINSVLTEVLSEEGFDDFYSTHSLTRGWSKEQREVLESIWHRT